MGCGDRRFLYLYAHDAEYVLGVDPKREEIAALAVTDRRSSRRVRFRVAKTIAPRRRFDVALFSWSL